MKTKLAKAVCVLTFSIVCCRLTLGQSRPDLHEVLRWFPAETHAIAVANGPFPLADLNDLEQMVQSGMDAPDVFSDEQLRQVFELPALAPWVGHRSSMEKRLLGEPVLLAVTAVRGGRRGQIFEYCTIVVFEHSIQDKLLKPIAGSPFMPEDIDGHGFVVMEDKPEEAGAPSLIVAQPRPNVLLIAGSLNYLKAVLARARGAAGERALPDTLPEWRYIDTRATFWALGHHQQPDSSLQSSESSEEQLDGESEDLYRRVFGATISFDPSSRTATMIFFSDDPRLLQKIQGEHQDSEVLEDGNSTGTTYKEIRPGIIESKTLLVDSSTARDFIVYCPWFLVAR